MSQPSRKFWSLVLSASLLATGCKPTQPFFCREDGDLSHYLDTATQIEYPDVDEPSLSEVTNALPPLTLKNTDNYEMWDLSLEEVVRMTLCNSQVMRQLGARTVSSAPETISRTLINPVAVTTTYDPALTESTTGIAVGDPFNGSGPEAALSEFDARLDSSVVWGKNNSPQNRANVDTLFPSIQREHTGNFTSGINKTTADGTTFGFHNNTIYNQNNTPSIFPSMSPAGNAGASQIFASDWRTNFEATFQRPLLQGAGTQYNRIAGPFDFSQYAAGLGNPIDGVMMARLRTDQSLADFEGGITNLMRDVEDAYWELYFTYRDLAAARKLGRDSALETWKKTAALTRAGLAAEVRIAKHKLAPEYFLFRAQVEQALTDLFRAENRLRFIIGISMSDGRLIRPSDEPTTARVAFDWSSIHCEAVTRRVEIRKEKWNIKQRELELIAARNLMLPRLDATGTYRWLGLGDNLLSAGNDKQFDKPGSTAFGTLASGDFQEWQLGLELNIPIGFRRELSSVRHQELLLARERAIMEDLELEISHQLGDAIRDIDLNYGLTQTNFNGRVASEKEVQAIQAAYEADRVTLDLLLDAQRRRAEAESRYYRSLIDYNKSIMNTHYRKGSLLDYNGVYLAEGPWPGKAYFDALREARKRDAGHYLDYGYTRPNVLSRGAYDQNSGAGCESGSCDSSGSTESAPLMNPEQYSPDPAQGMEQIPSPASSTPPPPSPTKRAIVPSDKSAMNGAKRGGTVLAGLTQGPGYGDQRQVSHAAPETAADAPIWQWAKR